MPGFELDEGPVGHDVDDFAGVPAVDRVLGLDVLPRARRLVLERQRDLFLLAVHVQDVDFEFLVDLDHVVRIGDAAPAHVGDVQQAVDAAEIDEGAELGDVLDDALADLALFDLGQQLFAVWTLRRSSISLRRLTTMLRRSSSILRILHSMVWSM